MLSAVPSIADTHQRKHASPGPLRCLRPIRHSPRALRKVPKHELHPHLNPAKHRGMLMIMSIINDLLCNNNSKGTMRVDVILPADLQQDLWELTISGFGAAYLP